MIQTEATQETLPESSFARTASRLAWIPLLGLFFYIVFAFLGLLQIGKGQLGFYRLRNGLLGVLLFTLLPLAGLVWWAELPTRYYFLFAKHGRFDNLNEQNVIVRSDYFRFGALFKTIQFYDNGSPRIEENFFGDKRHGYFGQWYENGQKQRDRYYRLNEFHGEFHEWFDDGQLRFSATYENDVPVGLWTGWYPNGRKLREGKYVKGRYEGTWRGWHSNGNIQFEMDYEKGIPVNRFNSWYSNGQQAVQGEYRNGERTKQWLTWDQRGTPIKTTLAMLKSRSIVSPPSTKKEQRYVEVLGLSSHGLSWHNGLEKGPKLQCFGKNIEELLPFSCTSLCLITNCTCGTEMMTDDQAMFLGGHPLESFYLGNNRLSETGLAYLKGMPIREMLFETNNPSDNWLKYLSGLPIEGICFLGSDYISSAGTASLKHLPLKKMSLSYFDINDSGMAELENIPLTDLSLSDLPITDAGLAYLKKMPLKNLSLRDLKITDAGLLHLQNIPLTSLHLDKINITDAGLLHLQNIPLTSLHLDKINITDEGLKALKNMPLKSLNLWNCNKITNAGVASLAGLTLDFLGLDYCEGISEQYRKIYDDPKEIQKILEEIGKVPSPPQKQKE